MADILLVLCSENIETSTVDTKTSVNIWHRALKLLGRLFYKDIVMDHIMDHIEESLKEIEVYNDLKVYLLQLPCTINDEVFRTIELVCSKKNIGRFYFSRKLMNIYNLKEHYEEVSGGRFLFQALVVEILKKLYPDKADIGHLDIIVIEGDNKNEVINVVRMLYPVTKFITLLAMDRTWLQKELEDIYINTGLSISVISDFKKGLNNADVIINFGDMGKIDEYAKVKPKAVILNFGPGLYKTGYLKSYLNKEEISTGNIVICSLEIYIPPAIMVKLGKLIPADFSSLEMAEFLIQNRIGPLSNNVQGDYIMQDMARTFKENGYYIKGFIGVNISDVSSIY